MEKDLVGRAELVSREPVAIDGRGLADDRLGLAGVDVDAEEEFRRRHRALRSQAHAAATDHHAFAAARIAPLGQAIGKRRQQRFEERLGLRVSDHRSIGPARGGARPGVDLWRETGSRPPRD